MKRPAHAKIYGDLFSHQNQIKKADGLFHRKTSRRKEIDARENALKTRLRVFNNVGICYPCTKRKDSCMAKPKRRSLSRGRTHIQAKVIRPPLCTPPSACKTGCLFVRANLADNKKPPFYGGFVGFKMVGARGFEPPTFCSQSRRTTRLCNAPSKVGVYYIIFGTGCATAASATRIFMV